MWPLGGDHSVGEAPDYGYPESAKSPEGGLNADAKWNNEESMREKKRWLLVAVFAVAMAWVESAVVFYLRALIDRINPNQTAPLPDYPGMYSTESVREAATLLMLIAIGWLAGNRRRTRWGYTAIAFGIWDIFYYVFLKVICDWPKTLWDADVLFLIPVPWRGPVIAPVLIALMMIAWGTLATQFEMPAKRVRFERRSWLVNFAGISLALYVFMADAIRVSGQGMKAIQNVVPERFNWPLFLVALLLMSVPVAHLAWQVRSRRFAPQETEQKMFLDGRVSE